MNVWQKFTGFTGIYTVRGHVSTNLAYQLTLLSPTYIILNGVLKAKLY